MENDPVTDVVRSPRKTPVLLTRWTKALQQTQRLRIGDARPDGFASLQWRRAAPRERWLRLRILAKDEPSDHALAIEFLLLMQRLLAADATECAQQVLHWLTDPASTKTPTSRLKRCCMGGCRLPGADADPVLLSSVFPCVSHSVNWRRPDNALEAAVVAPKKTIPSSAASVWVLGVVLDFEGAYDSKFLDLLHQTGDDPLGHGLGLSDEFRRAYLQLGPLMGDATTVRLHVRLSDPSPSVETLRNISTSLCTWHSVRRQSFCLTGLDVAASALNDLLAAAPMLPFHKLLVCASSSLASQMYPLSTPTRSLDDTSLRLLLTKSHHQLLELEVCNVQLKNFDCIVDPFITSGCQLQILRLREFAMGVVSTGGIFATLRDPFHLMAQKLEVLEIDQALHSAGGLSFWLEREAGEMLLKNDRLVTCLIRQACSIYPSTTHKGFWQTRGREIHVPVPTACTHAFLAASPIKLPRDVTARILEFAGRRATRDAQMHYRFISPDQLYQFTADLEAWKPQRAAPFECLPYGSYYH